MSGLDGAKRGGHAHHWPVADETHHQIQKIIAYKADRWTGVNGRYHQRAEASAHVGQPQSDMPFWIDIAADADADPGHALTGFRVR